MGIFAQVRERDMSKILVDSEELHNFISRAYEVIYSTPYIHPYTNQAKKASEILDDALDLIEKQEFEQRHFSVIEWHNPSEFPDDYEQILVRFYNDPENVYVKTAVIRGLEDGFGDPFWEFEHGESIDDVEEWAHMPE